MSRHREIRDAVAAHAAAWAGTNAPQATVKPTFNFQSLKNSIADDENEVIGVIVAGIEDNDFDAGARECDSDVVVIAVLYLLSLDDTAEDTANAADDKVESLRDHLKTLDRIQLTHQIADRERTTIPTPFDHGKLSKAGVFAAMIQTEYSVDVPTSVSISDEPPIS